MGRLSQQEKISFLGKNRVFEVFLSQNEYRSPRKGFGVPILIRFFDFNVI